MVSCIGNSTCPNRVLDTDVRSYCLGPAMKGWFQAISFLLFIGGSTGNLSVIIVIIKSLQDLSLTDLFLVGLAGFDLTASIFLPLYYFLEISNLLGPQTDSACGFHALMYEVSITITIFILLFTVYSFYREIALSRQDIKKKLRFILSLVIAFLLASIPSYPFVSSVTSDRGVCHMELGSYSSFVLYTVALFIIQVILPFLLFTIMFVLLGIDLYHGNRIVQNEIEAGVSMIERGRNQRKCKLLLIITCVFYMFYLPYVFMELWFITDIGSTIIDDYDCRVFDIFHLIVCFKCIANPVLYFFFFEGFKDNFRRVLFGCRIGRRYRFMQMKYYFRRDNQDGLVEHQDSEVVVVEDANELQDLSQDESPQNTSQSRLDDRDHDYDEAEDEQDKVAILRPWKNLKSASSF